MASPVRVTFPLELPTWESQRRELELLQRLAPHLMAARSKAASMVELPPGLPSGRLLVSVPIIGTSEAVLDSQTVVCNPEMNRKVCLWGGLGQGDLTTLAADAIVSSAPGTLLPTGAGLNGNVHRRGGAAVTDACRAIAESMPDGIVPMSAAVVTPGGLLPARHVIHAIPPHTTADLHLLAPTYEAVLSSASEHGFRTLGLCCLGSGDSGTIPEEVAALSALRVVRHWLSSSSNLAAVDRIVFAVHTARQHEIYEQLLAQVFPVDVE